MYVRKCLCFINVSPLFLSHDLLSYAFIMDLAMVMLVCLLFHQVDPDISTTIRWIAMKCTDINVF